MKLLTKFKQYKAQITLLRFIPIESKRVSFIFINKFVFLSSYLLWGYFFDHRNTEDVQRKVKLVDLISVHRQC